MPQGGPAQLCVCVCVCGEFEALIDVINKPQVAVAAAASNCKKIQMYLQAALTATCNVSLCCMPQLPGTAPALWRHLHFSSCLSLECATIFVYLFYLGNALPRLNVSVCLNLYLWECVLARDMHLYFSWIRHAVTAAGEWELAFAAAMYLVDTFQSSLC